jgi:hypothetical protein|tara:strand:+ start:156 stop:386 length:231 start_codon:yes stop_codon:yes gene_type:complete
MKQVDDHWMRPRTKAGTEEMRKRLKVMRELLQAAARHSMESEVAHKVFKEYFSFEWEDTLSLNIPEEELDTAAEVS